MHCKKNDKFRMTGPFASVLSDDILEWSDYGTVLDDERSCGQWSIQKASGSLKLQLVFSCSKVAQEARFYVGWEIYLSNVQKKFGAMKRNRTEDLQL